MRKVRECVHFSASRTSASLINTLFIYVSISFLKVVMYDTALTRIVRP